MRGKGLAADIRISLRKQRLHTIISQRVNDLLAVTYEVHETLLFHATQLMRRGTLRNTRCMRNVGNALGTLHEGIQNLETRWVGEDLDSWNLSYFCLKRCEPRL